MGSLWTLKKHSGVISPKYIDIEWYTVFKWYSKPWLQQVLISLLTFSLFKKLET